MQQAFESMTGLAGVFTTNGPALARAVFDDVKGMKDMSSVHFNVAAGVLAMFVAGAMSFNPVTLLMATIVAATEYGERGGPFASLTYLDDSFFRGIFYCMAGVFSGSGLGMMLLSLAGVRLVREGYADWSAKTARDSGHGSPHSSGHGSPYSSSPGGYSARVPLAQAGPPGCGTV